MMQLINEAKQVIEDARNPTSSTSSWTYPPSDPGAEDPHEYSEEESQHTEKATSWDFGKESYWEFACRVRKQTPYDNFMWLNERDKLLDLLKSCFREEFFRIDRVPHSNIKEHLSSIKDNMNFISIPVVFQGTDFQSGAVNMNHFGSFVVGKKVTLKRLVCSPQYGVHLESGDCIAIVTFPKETVAYMSSVIHTAIQHNLLCFERATIARLAPFTLSFCFSFHPRRKINLNVIDAQIAGLEPTFRKIRELWDSIKYPEVKDIKLIATAQKPSDLFMPSTNHMGSDINPFVEYVFGGRKKDYLRLHRFSADDPILLAVLKELTFLNLLREYKDSDFWLQEIADELWFNRLGDTTVTVLHVQIKRNKSKKSSPTVIISAQIYLKT